MEDAPSTGISALDKVDGVKEASSISQQKPANPPASGGGGGGGKKKKKGKK